MKRIGISVRRFLGGAGLLTAAALVGKLLGAVYRILLTRVLGAHGMGLYQSVFPTYALLVTLTGGGLTAAVSKFVAEDSNKKIAEVAGVFALCVSVPAAIVAALCSPAVASAAGAPSAIAALWMLLPAVPLSTLCAVLRGYFQGCGNMAPSAFGQLLEQLAKIGVGLTLSWALSRYGVAAGAAGCAAGVTAGEGASTLYYLFCYRKREKQAEATARGGVVAPKQNEAHPSVVASEERDAAPVGPVAEAAEDMTAVFANVPPAALRENARLLKRLLMVAAPITFGLALLPLCRALDSFTVVRLLVRAGYEQTLATSLYGLVSGPIDALVSMPAVLTVGLCGALLPKVSRLRAEGKSVRREVRNVLAVAAAVGVAFCAGLAFSAPLCLRVLYGSRLGVPAAEAATLLRAAAISVPCIPLVQVASAVLQGAGRAHVPACNLLVCAAIKETLQLLLLPRLGALGFVIATDAFYVLACLCDLIALALLGRKNARRTQTQISA